MVSNRVSSNVLLHAPAVRLQITRPANATNVPPLSLFRPKVPLLPRNPAIIWVLDNTISVIPHKFQSLYYTLPFRTALGGYTRLQRKGAGGSTTPAFRSRDSLTCLRHCHRPGWHKLRIYREIDPLGSALLADSWNFGATQVRCRPIVIEYSYPTVFNDSSTRLDKGAPCVRSHTRLLVFDDLRIQGSEAVSFLVKRMKLVPVTRRVRLCGSCCPHARVRP